MNDQRKAFLRNLVAGLTPPQAYRLAYSNSTYVVDEKTSREGSSRLMHDPAMLAALHVAIGRQLAADAVIARRVAVELLQDPGVSDKVRADLSIKMLNCAREPRS